MYFYCRYALLCLYIQLLIFKLIALIFPTSDFKHPVVTPALLFMGQLLLKVRHMCMVQDSTQHQCRATAVSSCLLGGDGVWTVCVPTACRGESEVEQ